MYAAALLALVEAEVLEGGSVADHVEMIAGTSTGGIIGIGLGLGKPAALIERLYVEDGKRVFPVFWSRHPRLRFIRQFVTSLYNSRALEALLYEAFRDATLGESRARFIIPAFLGPNSQVAVLKTDHHPDFRNDHRMTAWEAARATSAAPAYLPGHSGEGNEDYVFLDGGIWANNPIMLAVVDALSSYEISRDQIQVLSIGTGNSPYQISRFAHRGGFFQWREIIKGAIFLTTDNAQAQATLLLGPQSILRLEPTGAAAAIDLADWGEAVRQLPGLAQAHFREHRDSISAFLSPRASPRHRFYTAIRGET